MNIILKDVINNGVNVYLDDIVIHTKTRNEHMKLVRKVLQRLKERNLVINQKKYN